MGSTLSPILTTRVIYNLMETVLFQLPDMAFFKIYVDDSIAAIHKNEFDTLLTKISTYNSDL